VSARHVFPPYSLSSLQVLHPTSAFPCTKYIYSTSVADMWRAISLQVMTLNHPNGRKQDFIFNKASSDMNFAN